GVVWVGCPGSAVALRGSGAMVAGTRAARSAGGDISGAEVRTRTMSRISIASPQDFVPIDRGRMREVVRAVLDGEGVAEAEISLASANTPPIHRLNQRYLQHDEPTDVLSFPLSELNAASLSTVGPGPAPFRPHRALRA